MSITRVPSNPMNVQVNTLFYLFFFGFHQLQTDVLKKDVLKINKIHHLDAQSVAICLFVYMHVTKTKICLLLLRCLVETKKKYHQEKCHLVFLMKMKIVLTTTG